MRSEGEEILLPSLQVRSIIAESRSPEVGQPSDRFALNLRVEFTAWGYIEGDINHVAAMALDAALPTGYQQQPDTLQVKMLQDAVFEAGRASWRMRAQRTVQSQWNQTALIQSLRGVDPDNAPAIIEQFVELRSPAIVNLKPNWWFRMPYLPYQFLIQVN
jgi:hypothetical protein